LTKEDIEKLNIKKKSFGYFVDNYFYDRIELCNDDSLHIETNALTEKDWEELINFFIVI
jgi:hypothetical protein